MNREYHFRAKGDAEQIRRALESMAGEIERFDLREDEVDIIWRPNTDTDPHQQIADMMRTGNHADGILLLELFLSDDPADTTALFNLGMAYSDQGEWHRAIEVLRKLIEYEPQHTNGLVALGVALLRANQTQDGIYELQHALTQGPDNVWARQNLGAGLLQLGHHAEALEHLRHAVEIKADDPALWFDYGRALQMNNDVRAAQKAYRKVIDLDESSEIAQRAHAALGEK